MPPLTTPSQPPVPKSGRAWPATAVPAERPPAADSQLEVLRRLAQDVGRLETSGRCVAAQARVSSAGCAALDSLLPGGGYKAGSVVEYLRTSPACGASTLVWAAAAAAMQSSAGFLVVVDTQHHIFPPALTSHGIDLGKVIFVRPSSQADALWTVDQALRTVAVAAVVAELECIDDRSARRLQLAAEQGAGLALLLRSAAARKQPSWAEVQWLVRTAPMARPSRPLACAPSRPVAPSLAPSHRRWWMQLARVRGGRAGQSVCLEIDPITGQLKLAVTTDSRHRNSHGDSAHPQAIPSKGAMHLAAQLAHSTSQPTPEHLPHPNSRRAAAS